MTGWPSGSTLNLGEGLTLTCNAANTGETPTSFEWYKGSTLLTSTGTKDETYEVTNVAVTDAGDYKCKAINNAGNAESTPQTLVVIGKYPSQRMKGKDTVSSTKCNCVQ